MKTYRVTTAFEPVWKNVFEALFPGKQHDASTTSQSEATFSFNDPSVTPADLGPLVRVELISE
jgi:hypothetical protein